MILPSDETPRRPDDPDDTPPWHNEPEPPGFFGEEDDEAKVHNPAPEGWREELSADLADALHELKEIEDPAEDFDPPEPPDLFTFYNDLVAMRQDLNAMNLAAGEWVKGVLGKGPQAMPGGTAKAGKGKKQPDDPVALLESVIQFHDEVEASQKSLLVKMTPLLRATGLERILTRGQPFDPETMRTKDKVREGSRVAAELQSGWIWNGAVLRPAQVSLK